MFCFAVIFLLTVNVLLIYKLLVVLLSDTNIGIFPELAVKVVAESLFVADKFVNIPFYAIILLNDVPLDYMLSNCPIFADILLNFFQSKILDIASANLYPFKLDNNSPLSI
jgi:hypothetical protein